MSVMTTPIETLDRTLAVLRDLDLDQAARGADDTLLNTLARVEQLGRVLDATRVRIAAEVERRSDRVYGQDGLAARHGQRTAALLLEQVSGASATTVRQLLRVGKSTGERVSDTGAPLPPLFPAVGSALAAGTLHLDVADAITKELAKASPRAVPTNLADAEHALVGEATGQTSGVPLSADLIAIQARQWRDALDPDGVEPRADEAYRNRALWVSRTPRDGAHPVGGAVTPEVAAQWFELQSAMATPRSAPKFRASGDREPMDEIPDDRTPEQQGHDLFATMLTHFAATTNDLTVSGSAPTVIVTVRAEDLLRDEGTGRIVGVADPVAMSTVRQHACNGILQRAILGPLGNLVALEHGKRLFTRSQRLGIIARDGDTCLFAGCRVPATACEAHHVTEWSHDQRTAADNGVLVCYHHHRSLERREWTIEVVRGRPRVRPPDWLIRRPYLRR